MGLYTRASDEGSLFTLELSSHGGSASFRGKEPSPYAGTAGIDTEKLALYSAPATMFEYKLLEALRRLKPACVRASGVDYNAMSELLSALGYTVEVHSSQCGCRGAASRRCLEVLNHTYVTCSGTTDYNAEDEVVVEPRLREHFEIAHPTEGFARLLRNVPAEFVGPRAKLRVVVEAVAAAMAEAFRAQDLPLPPWRRASAMLSKWDLDLTVSGRSPARSPEQATAWQVGAPDCAAKPKKHGQQRYGFPENTAGAEGSGPPASQGAFAAAAIQRLSSGKLAAQRARKPPVSLLARGLADMAIVQKAKRPADSGKATPKLKRAPSWDFSGLAPITTVRRSGRVK